MVFHFFKTKAGNFVFFGLRGRLHDNNIGNNAASEFLLEEPEHFILVHGEVVLHRGTVEFDKQNLVPDLNLSGAACNGLARQTLPGVDHLGFVEPTGKLI